MTGTEIAAIISASAVAVPAIVASVVQIVMLYRQNKTAKRTAIINSLEREQVKRDIIDAVRGTSDTTAQAVTDFDRTLNP